MKLTPEEIKAAKKQIARMIESQRLDKLSPEDRALALKYPRLTLEAARMVDAHEVRGCSCYKTPVNVCRGFSFLRWQETGHNQ